MNIPKITNKIAITTTILLIYWIFIFICINILGFKVFQQNITELFFFSVFGLFTILCSAMIINIMYNLTAIANKYQKEETKLNKKSYLKIIYFTTSLVVIFTSLYVGNIMTSKKKETYFINSAKALVQEYSKTIEAVSNYHFSKNYINKTSSNIKFLSKIDENFPEITVIHLDKINNKNVLLNFSQYNYHYNVEKEPKKVDFILSTSKEERKYLFSIFSKQSIKHKFSSNKGRYEIYYPIKIGKKIVVLYFSQYNRYGKLGS